MSVESDELRHDLEGQRALEEYQARPPATWEDVERAYSLRDQLARADVGFEAVGAEGIPSDPATGLFPNEEYRRLGNLILSLIIEGDNDELGRVLMEQAQPYVIRCAQFDLEYEGCVKSDLDDLLRDLA